MRRAIPVLVMVSLLLVAGTAVAGEERNTETIENYEGIGIKIDNTDGSTLDIKYDVKVTIGVPVNVFFMDYSDWFNYEAGLPFEYYILFSNTGVMDIEESWTWDEEGVFYVVIDNSHDDPSNQGNATVDYKVTWEEWGATDWLLWGGACAAIVVVLIIINVAFRRLRKKSKEAAPQAFEAQPLQTYDQPVGQPYDSPPTQPFQPPPAQPPREPNQPPPP